MLSAFFIVSRFIRSFQGSGQGFTGASAMGNIAREGSSFWAEACWEVNTFEDISSEESHGFSCGERNQYLRDRTSGLLLFVSPSGEGYIIEELKQNRKLLNIIPGISFYY